VVSTIIEGVVPLVAIKMVLLRSLLVYLAPSCSSSTISSTISSTDSSTN
jgi:hypothetical protein